MNRAKELFRSYKFATFIGLTIAISAVLVSIAMLCITRLTPTDWT